MKYFNKWTASAMSGVKSVISKRLVSILMGKL